MKYFNIIILTVFRVLLLGLPVYITVQLYQLDKDNFICPITYAWDLVIRCDSRGDGAFAAKRNGARVHNGIDLVADLETPVKASQSGRASVRVQKDGMGNYVVLYHKNKLTTLYGHLHSVKVKDGSFVKQADIIGTVGKTGNANHPAMQPHLHFEVRKDGVLQDPQAYLP